MSKWITRYEIKGDPFKAARERPSFSLNCRRVATVLDKVYLPVLMSGGYKEYTLGMCPDILKLPAMLNTLAKHVRLLDGFKGKAPKGRPRKELNVEVEQLIRQQRNKFGKPNYRKVADQINARFDLILTEDDVKKAEKSQNKLNRIWMMGKPPWKQKI